MKTTVGLVEKVEIAGQQKKKVLAKFDTGAARTTIDIYLAGKVQLGPVVGRAKIRTAHGIGRRPIVLAQLNILGKAISASVALADRKNQKYKLLIGRDIISRHFIVDTSKTKSI